MSTYSEDLHSAAIAYHQFPRPGKLEIQAIKPLANQRDLALAYSPGVAAACMEIAGDPAKAADLTIRANLVAVVTNGTAVLGLGNIGPLASKPVMEGKAVLFKKFAGIDVFDIELAADTIDKVVEAVAALEPTFGGINLEDIKGPECFEIEARLKERMKIPGLPRRPARHRHHRRRRDQECAAAQRQETRRHQDRRLGRGRRGDCLPQSAGFAGRAAQEYLGLRYRRRRA